MFRALWQKIAGLFGGKKQEQQQRSVPGIAPAPETLVARVAAVKDKDRDMLRLANEAIRRGHPQQAVIAYWKAVKKYLDDGQYLKAVSALKMIIQHAPEDADAYLTLIEAYVQLERQRDAALACMAAADMHVAAGRRDEGLALLTRSHHLDPTVKGVRERISALGGQLPEPSEERSAVKLRMKSTVDVDQAATAPPQPVQPAPPKSDDGPIELDIPADEFEFPDDSLVVPVAERSGETTPQLDDELELPDDIEDDADPNDATVLGMQSPVQDPANLDPTAYGMEVVTPPSASTDPANLDATAYGMEAAVPDPDDGAQTVMGMQAVSVDRSMDVLLREPDIGQETEPDGIQGAETDPGAATIAMSAVDASMLHAAADDLYDDDDDDDDFHETGADTVIGMSAIDMPTDETSPAPLVETRRPAFNIPDQSTAFEPGLPSSVVGTEHDPTGDLPTKPKEPEIGGSTKAYGPDELRALGIKVPTSED